MRVDRLLILTLAAFITAGEAFAVMHATASLDNPRNTSRHDAYTAHGAARADCRTTSTRQQDRRVNAPPT
jgi:hypothetical protein